MAHFLLRAATTLLLLLSLSPPPTKATHAGDNIVLRDRKGDPIVPGAFYYAIPYSWPLILDNGGGLTTLDRQNNTFCPFFYMAQLNDEQDKGIPISFTPKDPHQNHVTLSSDVSISVKYLSPSPGCRRRYTTVWQVIPDDATKDLYVTLDGVPEASNTWFKIEQINPFRGYNIAFYQRRVNVLRDDQGRRLLGIGLEKSPQNYQTYEVVFVKA